MPAVVLASNTSEFRGRRRILVESDHRSDFGNLETFRLPDLEAFQLLVSLHSILCDSVASTRRWHLEIRLLRKSRQRRRIVFSGIEMEL